MKPGSDNLELAGKAPPSTCFPAHPASWYLFCHERELSRGPVSKPILGKRLVAFRTASGKVAVLDAHCSHLGADLGCGTVTGETVQCPFHHWQYAIDGQCTHIPALGRIPPFARQRSYPAVLRHGYLFFFNGVEALFPLPFFRDTAPQNFSAAPVFRFTAHCSWYMTAAQGFDTQHFEAVHERKLLAPPSMDSPSPFVLRNRYRAEVVGTSRFDRLLRLFAGRTVDVTIENWGGTFFCVTAQFARAHSRFLAINQPLEEEESQYEVIAFAPRSPNPVVRSLLDPASLWLRRLFTQGHLTAEARHIRHTQYRPASLISSDHDMIRCFQWLASLPQSCRPVPKSGEPQAIEPSLCEKSHLP
jgi:phenylpropionate dioxygenase-like ring-hydroxylating dioxygenase large terminal subunit